MKTKTANAGRTTTRKIAGHEITLTRGQRYMAGRPFAERGRKTYPVTIYDITNGFNFHNTAGTIDGLTYQEANKLLLAFNNGPMSFDGRVW